ncbi:MAG: zinc-dependent alcohol dehydrogenase family protein [Dictyoglomaceae bacterium]
MLGAMLDETGKLVLRECPKPFIKSSEVLIKVLAAGICGTDLHIFSGKGYGKPNIIRGHEFSGKIVEIGSEVKGFKIGDLVAIDPNISCGNCYFCRRGEVHLCENLKALGVDLDGGFSDYCAVPYDKLYKLPAGVSPEEGAMMEPCACALHGIEKIKIKPGDTVLVIGGGALGLILLQLAYIYGASKVFLSEPVKEKREIAESFFAHTFDPQKEDVASEIRKLTGVGVDIAIEAVGRADTVELAINSVRRGGKVLIFGVADQKEILNISPFDIYYKEITLMGSFVNPYTNSRALELIANKRIDVKRIISHKFPLKEIHKAVETGLSGKALRILIVWENSE